MLILRHDDVRDILAGRETELMDLVADVYRLHDEGATAVPHSLFLRFPDNARNRIISLPAFVGGDRAAAGMKWIASFPGNLDLGLPRASAAIVVNALDTGQPQALIEGSLISAKRTAASAALAAKLLAGEPAQGLASSGPRSEATRAERAGFPGRSASEASADSRAPTGATLIGCGVINLEVLRFLVEALPGLREVTLFDSAPDRAASFAQRCRDVAPKVHVTVAVDAGRALAAHDLVSIATTAAEPHLDLGPAPDGALVLHVSLRDLHPETILASQNVVDDADHVCRERTSLHLTEQQVGDRHFIHASIGQLLRGTGDFRRDPARRLVFSPFGLGALDIALAEFVRASAEERGLGVRVDDFLGGTGNPPVSPPPAGKAPVGNPIDKEQ